MGHEFDWYGSIPDRHLQERAVEFVRSWWKEKEQEALAIITPEPALRLKTLIQRFGEDEHREEYPFNFYGIAPFFGERYPVNGYRQFVFDRTDGGRMVTLLMTPETREPADEKEWDTWQYREWKTQGFQVVLKPGGHDDLPVGGEEALSLLLNIFKLRYCPFLKMRDDFHCCSTVSGNIRDWMLEKTFRDESKNFIDCWRVYRNNYNIRYPDRAKYRTKLKVLPKIHPITPEEARTRIEELDLSIRALKVLKKMGIETLGDLTNTNRAKLLRTKNMGRKTVYEIENILTELGLCLREEPDETR